MADGGSSRDILSRSSRPAIHGRSRLRRLFPSATLASTNSPRGWAPRALPITEVSGGSSQRPLAATSRATNTLRDTRTLRATKPLWDARPLRATKPLWEPTLWATLFARRRRGMPRIVAIHRSSARRARPVAVRRKMSPTGWAPTTAAAWLSFTLPQCWREPLAPTLEASFAGEADGREIARRGPAMDGRS